MPVRHGSSKGEAHISGPSLKKRIGVKNDLNQHRWICPKCHFGNNSLAFDMSCPNCFASRPKHPDIYDPRTGRRFPIPATGASSPSRHAMPGEDSKSGLTDMSSSSSRSGQQEARFSTKKESKRLTQRAIATSTDEPIMEFDWESLSNTDEATSDVGSLASATKTSPPEREVSQGPSDQKPQEEAQTATRDKGRVEKQNNNSSAWEDEKPVALGDIAEASAAHSEGELATPHLPQPTSATVDTYPGWLLSMRHNRLFRSILQLWDEFTNRDSSSQRVSKSPTNPPPSLSGDTSSAKKRKTSPTDEQTSADDSSSNSPNLNSNLRDASPDESARLFACHYCKFDANQHRDCIPSTFKDVRSVTQHLRQVHRVTKERLPKMPIQKGRDEYRKWYWTWGMLFNGHPEPESPYANPYELLDQFILFAAQLERGPEIHSALIHARLLFSGLQDRPVGSEDEKGALDSSVPIDGSPGQNRTPQVNQNPDATDTRAWVLLDASTSGSASSSPPARTPSADGNKDSGTNTSTIPASEPIDLPHLIPGPVVTPHVPLTGSLFREIQSKRETSQGQTSQARLASSPPTEAGGFTDDAIYSDTAFWGAPNAHSVMPCITPDHGSLSDDTEDFLASFQQINHPFAIPGCSGMLADGNVQYPSGNSRASMPLETSGTAFNEENLEIRERGHGGIDELSTGPWDGGDAFSEPTYPGFDSADDLSWIDGLLLEREHPSDGPWPGLSIDCHSNTGTHFCLDSPGKGKGKAVEAPKGWA